MGTLSMYCIVIQFSQITIACVFYSLAELETGSVSLILPINTPMHISVLRTQEALQGKLFDEGDLRPLEVFQGDFSRGQPAGNKSGPACPVPLIPTWVSLD